MRKLISSGSSFEKTAGYSRAVVDGDMVYVSGTTGMDYATMVMPSDIETQTINTLETIKSALEEAGASMGDIVRARYYVSDRADVEAVFAILGRYFGDIRPAATMIVCDLIQKQMKIEIEVTARIGSA